jgi:hypothetical protein
MPQPDLFPDDVYPNAPGARRNKQSRNGASFIAPHAKTLRERVLSVLRHHALTAHEVAIVLDVPNTSTQPRISELVKLGNVVDSGRTRKNGSGVNATVWKAIA